MTASKGYERPEPLASRLAIYAWQRDRVDLHGLAAAALADVSGVVLDVGCGPGSYARRIVQERPDLRVATVDLSPGMRPLVVADAVALPFADGTAGAALAMHMLYHVPDVAAAVAELRRTVRPGGTLLVSTNGRGDKPELAALVDGVLRELSGIAGRERFVNPSERFTAEDGALLEAQFDCRGQGRPRARSARAATSTPRCCSTSTARPSPSSSRPRRTCSVPIGPSPAADADATSAAFAASSNGFGVGAAAASPDGTAGGGP